LSKTTVKDFLFKHDLLHVPHNFEFVSNPDKTVLTIHDALFYSYPEDFLGHSFARKNYPELARNCKGIVTCSKSSKSDIIQFMGVPEEKITVIPWGVNEKIFFRSDENKTTEKLRQIGLHKPFFLMVSCDIGRKNTLNVMRAYSKFSNNNVSHMLVLVWSNPPQAYLNEFADEIANGRIVFLSGIDDQLLQNLYSGATVSFFPSRYEGFGLPILESMACGTPVVTCANSSLKEVGGEAAIYVDPDGIDEMAEVMSEFERGSFNRDDLVQKSIANASNFTWKKTAFQYIDFYDKNLNA
jgi:glycosyltransferase involved in cell wall biosynthesis